MFRTEKQLAEIEEANAHNWAKWHKRKKLITWPLKLIAAALALSFIYSAGEMAGVEACHPELSRK